MAGEVNHATPHPAMTAVAREWKFYFPDDGDTADDSCPITGWVLDADHAAREACEYDFCNRDGWERGDREFQIAVISPNGVETRFIGRHEPSVEHTVRSE